MPCNDCSANGDGSRAYSVSLIIKLDDFTQLSWYKSLYSQPNSTILKTNEAPLDVQLPSLRANQLEAITELEKVDQKIEAIRSTLSDAITHRARLQKVVDDFRSALSPIRRVPSEIVHKILKDIDTKDSAILRRKPGLNVTLYNGPWRFSTVCQLWRAVAIQSPEFWSHIHIDFRLNNHREYRSLGLCALLDEGIRRSASRGIRVSLDQEPLSSKEEENSVRERNEDDSGRDVIKALFDHSSQIRTLAMKMCSSPMLNDILSSSRCSFTSLQCLSIELMFCDPENGSDILEAFYGSPSLVEVKLDRFPVAKPYRELHFPWNQLQVFEHIPSRSLADAIDVVRFCPRLQKYKAACFNMHTLNLTVPPTAVHHTAITHLELAKDSLPLLQHTRIPSLTVLRMLSAIDNSQLTTLAQFISRSRCLIQDLHISLLHTSPRYDAFLELFPSLTRLSLHLENIIQLTEFQSALIPERLPRLEELKIEVFGEMSPALGTLLALCKPQVISTLVHTIHSRRRNLQSFIFGSPSWRRAACKDLEFVRKTVDLLHALLRPYAQSLRACIEGGMELQLYLGKSPQFNFHVNAVPVD
jgi:hypothetical protein